MTKTKSFIVKENATLTADGNSDPISCAGASKVSLYVNATLGGTTPSLNAFVQTKDAAGNWRDVGSGAGAITATGTTEELGITGPFGDQFRVRFDVDVTDTNETYTGVDAVLAIEYDPTA